PIYGWIVGACKRGSLVPRGPDIGIARLRCGKAQGMVYRSGGNLLVTDQSGQDWQPRRIGRGPGRRTQGIAADVEYRSRAGVPAGVGVRVGGEELVELAVVPVDNQNVPVAV